MNPPSEDIKTILDGESSLALEFETNLFVSEMPASPDECVCVYDTGGYDPDADVSAENIYLKPTVQVRVRGAKGEYRDAHNLAQAIRDTLNCMHNEEVDGARYLGIWCMGDVLFIGYDDNHRPLLTVNFRLDRTKT